MNLVAVHQVNPCAFVSEVMVWMPAAVCVESQLKEHRL